MREATEVSLKIAVQVIIFNSENQIVAVSRKDNHSDFGLPGGKNVFQYRCSRLLVKRGVAEGMVIVYSIYLSPFTPVRNSIVAKNPSPWKEQMVGDFL